MLMGAMICFDLGGPVNKVAMAVAVMFLSGSMYDPRINGIAAVSVSVPPMVLVTTMGMTRLFGMKFDENDQAAATSAGIMGFFGITEGAIPFAAKQPKLYIPSFMLAGMVGGILMSFTGVGNNVAM